MLMNKLDILAEKIPNFKKWIIDKRVKKHFYKYFEDIGNKQVLEIGCGNGEGAVVIKKYFSPSKIIASDFDPNLIAFAKSNIYDPVIDFEQQDAAKLNYKNNQFDGIFSFKVIHHIPNWKDCVGELYRVLKKRGKVYIIDMSIEDFNSIWGKILKLITTHPYQSMYRREEFIDYLKKTGFKIIEKASSNKFLDQYFVIIAQK
jgi:ubiquinone/menaquinone biosynthesis C-methylase UbiE